MKYYHMLLVLKIIMIPSISLGMEPKGAQLELCPTRKVYNQSQKAQPSTICSFCDPENLAKNYIVEEDEEKDCRIIMNLFPYVPFNQGHQFVIMPISHKAHPHEFSYQEMNQLTDKMQWLTTQLHDDSYTIENFANYGALAGQTVRGHWHSQMKAFTRPPLSIPNLLKDEIKNASPTTIEQAFALVQLKLARNSTYNHNEKKEHIHNDCTCCTLKDSQKNNEANLIVERFKHNYICLSHYPSLPGEVCVIPNMHVSTIKDLSPEALQENMALAMALLPKMKEYAQQNIRECDGGNILSKSLGGKASEEEHTKYHVYTVVMPRTTVPLTPGFMQDSSCKLDYDPIHLLAYLKGISNTLLLT